MAKRPRGGDEDPPDSHSARKPGFGSGDPASVRDAQIKAQGKAQDGRLGADRGKPSADLVTERTGTSGGAPAGHPTDIPRRADNSVQRSIARENSGAVIIAGHGYEIKQNPSLDEVANARQEAGDAGRAGTRPDYLIEERVFDCYSPDDGKPVRGIWSEAAGKVEDGQTQRVIVNLEDWSGDVGALRRQFLDWPIEGLKEVKAITRSGEVVQIDLPPANE